MNKILIADDNLQLLEILKTAAKKEGYEVGLAEDGQMALEMYYMHDPQMVLLDVMMPKMDGFQVCREIRKEILGDYVCIRQLCIILLDNAVKFSHEKGNIEVVLRDGDTFMIQVFPLWL